MTSPEGQAGYGPPPPVYPAYNPGYQQQYPMENINPAAPEAGNSNRAPLIQPLGQGQQNDNPDEAAASESQAEKDDEGVLKSGLKSVPENYLNVSTASISIARHCYSQEWM